MVSPLEIFPSLLCITNRFQVAVGQFSNRSQKISICSKNISDSLGCPWRATFLSLNRCTATWNLIVILNRKKERKSKWINEWIQEWRKDDRKEGREKGRKEGQKEYYRWITTSKCTNEEWFYGWMEAGRRVDGKIHRLEIWRNMKVQCIRVDYLSISKILEV